MYRTEDGVSNFTCALNANLPTLVVIRKDLNIIGGFINRGKEGRVLYVSQTYGFEKKNCHCNLFKYGYSLQIRVEKF